MSSSDFFVCSRCSGSGDRVHLVTLESLLHPEAWARVRPSRYRFCASSDCEVVYFPEDGSSPFTKPDLTVRVGIKEQEGPRLVCYCFGHSIEEVQQQVEETGGSTVPTEILARIQADTCWCRTKNPHGRCCLGAIRQLIRDTASLQSEPASTVDECGDCCHPTRPEIRS